MPFLVRESTQHASQSHDVAVLKSVLQTAKLRNSSSEIFSEWVSRQDLEMSMALAHLLNFYSLFFGNFIRVYKAS